MLEVKKRIVTIQISNISKINFDVKKKIQIFWGYDSKHDIYKYMQSAHN